MPALLVRAEYSPNDAAVMVMLGTMVAHPFGTYGIPIRVMAELAQLDEQHVAAAVGRVLLPFSILIPFAIAYVAAGAYRPLTRGQIAMCAANGVSMTPM